MCAWQVRLDLNRGTLNVLLDDDELRQRWARHEPPPVVSHTPWEELYRSTVGQLQQGGCMELACKYQRVAAGRRVPRHNH